MRESILGTILFYTLLNFTFAQQPSLQFFPNFRSIGYRITLPAGFDSDTNATVAVKYYSVNHPLDTGFSPYRLRQDTFNEFRGSLFMLEPNTKYHIQITLTDSTPTLQSFTFNDSVMTRSEPIVQPTSNIKYVSPTGSGNAYTLANPGNLATLINNNLVTCGTTVMLLDGVYDVGNMTLNINSDCTPQTPIVIMAAPGAHPVLDGGYHQQINWTQDANDTTLYSTSINNQTPHLLSSLCLLDGERLYPYPIDFNHQEALSNLFYGLSGFYRDFNKVFIKTVSGKNPNHHQVILSKWSNCLTVQGVGQSRNSYLTIKGLTINYYSKPFYTTNFLGNIQNPTFPAVALWMKNVNYVLIDSCVFSYNNFAIEFEGVCNFNTVQHCEISDQTGLWGHEAFKNTNNEVVGMFIAPNGTIGRKSENIGIYFYPSPNARLTGNVIRDNKIVGIVAGIVTGNVNDVSQTTETDIYNNEIVNCYDALDNLSGQINLRAWNNRINHAVVGLSFIAGRYGPRYVFRNVISNINDRKNPSPYSNDLLFRYCNGTISDKIWGTGIKMNAGNITTNPGALFLMHNTFHASDTLAFAMYLLKSDWRKLYSRNNIYYNEGLSTFFFDDVGNDPKYSFNSEYDNFFNATTGAIATVQPVNAQSLCYTYYNPAQTDTGLRNVTQATDVRIKNAQNSHPQFKATGSDFRLMCNSPMIDNGVILPGINNRSFKGTAPDIGAFEFEKTTLHIASTNSIQQIDTVSHFTITGTLNVEHVYDTIYTNINAITHDTLTHVDCIWVPTGITTHDSSFTITTTDTTYACDTTVIQTNQFNYTFTTLNIYDTTMCDTLITYKTTVKINVVNLNDFAEQKIVFYPNPARESVWFTDGVKDISSVQLVNALGRLMPVTFSGNQILLYDMPEGIYWVIINQNTAGKLIVQRKMN